MRISDWSSDVCSSDLRTRAQAGYRSGNAHPEPVRSIFENASPPENVIIQLASHPGYGSCFFDEVRKCHFDGSAGGAQTRQHAVQKGVEARLIQDARLRFQYLDESRQIGRESCRERVCQYV